ncbi:MAG: ABC transporter permease [Solobacterium sp.]|nr:ABC transporter permease [Solobacterium sp.]
MKNEKLSLFLRKYILYIIMIVIGAATTCVNARFLSINNFVNILRSVSIQGVLACGVTMILVSGNIDLSFGSMIGLTGVIIGYGGKFFQTLGMSPTPACIISILIAFAVATVIGLINGYFVSKWKMPAMMVTVATQFLMTGLGGIISGGYPTNEFPSWFTFFGKDRIGIIPYSVLIVLVFFAVFYVILNKTKFGRTIYAVGGNAEASRLSGIDTKKYIFSVYVIMQWCAVVAGIIMSSQLMQGSHSYGGSVTFNVIAAVIIGGCGMSGGTGNMKGTITGLILLGIIQNSLTIINASEYTQYVVRAFLIIFSIWLTTVQELRANATDK